MKNVRKIIEINEDLCNGCGECVTACAEGALRIIDGKARLVSEIYCDGLGACLGGCPTGALKVVEREAEEFDEVAVERHLRDEREAGKKAAAFAHSGCPSSRVQMFGGSPCDTANRPSVHAGSTSALTHWPVQIRLIPASAPFLKGADLLVAADCTPVAYPGFQDILEGKVVMLGCPKFDDADLYIQKFADIFSTADIKSITVLIMEVPCCSKLPMIVERAMAVAGRRIPMEVVVVGTRGSILKSGKVMA